MFGLPTLSRRSFLAGATSAAARAFMPCVMPSAMPTPAAKALGVSAPLQLGKLLHFYALESPFCPTYPDFSRGNYDKTTNTFTLDLYGQEVDLTCKQILDRIELITYIEFLLERNASPQIWNDILVQIKSETYENAHNDIGRTFKDTLWLPAQNVWETFRNNPEARVKERLFLERSWLKVMDLHNKTIPQPFSISQQNPNFRLTFSLGRRLDLDCIPAANLDFPSLYEQHAYKRHGIRPGVYTCPPDIESVFKHPLFAYASYLRQTNCPTGWPFRKEIPYRGFEQKFTAEQHKMFDAYSHALAQLIEDLRNDFSAANNQRGGVMFVTLGHNTAMSCTDPKGLVEALKRQFSYDKQHRLLLEEPIPPSARPETAGPDRVSVKFVRAAIQEIIASTTSKPLPLEVNPLPVNVDPTNAPPTLHESTKPMLEIEYKTYVPVEPIREPAPQKQRIYTL